MTLTHLIRARGALTGLLSGAIGVSVGFLVSGLTGPVGSPVIAVAEFAIDLSPPPVKNFAIREFGTHDKLVLQIGVVIVLAVFAAVIGILAQRKLANGLIGIGIFGVVGLLAAGTRPTSAPQDAAADPGGLGRRRARHVLAHRAAGPASGGRKPEPKPAVSRHRHSASPATPAPALQSPLRRPAGQHAPASRRPACR